MSADGDDGDGAPAVLRHLDGEANFTLSFSLRSDRLGLDKQFNLHRPMEETRRQFIDRLNNNVEKVLKKTIKRRKNRSDAPLLEESATAVAAKFVTAEGEEVDPGQEETPVSRVLFRSGVYLEVLGRKIRLEHNPPTVERMQLPDRVAMCGFEVRPRKLQLRFAQEVKKEGNCVATSTFIRP